MSARTNHVSTPSRGSYQTVSNNSQFVDCELAPQSSNTRRFSTGPNKNDMEQEVTNHTPRFENNILDKTLDDEPVIPEESRRYSHHVSKTKTDGIANEDECDQSKDKKDEPFFVDVTQLNEDSEESAILEHIERKVEYTGLCGEGGTLIDLISNTVSGSHKDVNVANNPQHQSAIRGRASSMIQATMDLFNRARAVGRKNSIDSNDNVVFEVDGTITRATGFRLFCLRLHAVFQYLVPNFYSRVNSYMAVLFMLIIAFVASEFAPPNKVFTLYICTVLLELACSIADRALYKIIDVVFVTNFDVAYQLHSFNGPFGMIVGLLIIRNYWDFFEANSLIKGWDSYVTAASVFVICLCAKNWLGRKQYIYLLENRFTEKVEGLNNMIIILSELASTRPPKSVQLQRAMTKDTAAQAAAAAAAATHNMTSSRSMAVHTVLKSALGGVGGMGTGLSAVPAGPSDSTTGTSKSQTHGKYFIPHKVLNVFEELVEPTADANTEDVITKKEMYRKRRSFWQSAARLSKTAGVMRIITYNGIVTIASQDQAKTFGKKLYKHLSKGGKVMVTPELIRRLFEERRELASTDAAEMQQHTAEMANITSAQATAGMYEGHEEEKQELWSVAVGLFDPFGLGKVSEDYCIEAVVNIYKEQRFTTASINDFSELHQSLRLGIDIIYWIIMLFVLQSFFGFDVTTYLLPFITLLLTVSFAIAPLVGNVFLAFAFVFLMSPYDIGHKVQFGLFNLYTPPIIGYIKSVTLLYTIVTTIKNETVKIPNHTLYSERIFNLTETSSAVYDFFFSFNMFGVDNADMERINTFFQKLKHYTLRESKEWKTFVVFATTTNSLENSLEYRVVVSHREGWGFYKAAAAARLEYFSTIKRLREELNLPFLRLPQRVVLTRESSEAFGPTDTTATSASVPSIPVGSVATGVDVAAAHVGVNRFNVGLHPVHNTANNTSHNAIDGQYTSTSTVPTPEIKKLK